MRVLAFFSLSLSSLFLSLSTPPVFAADGIRVRDTAKFTVTNPAIHVETCSDLLSQVFDSDSEHQEFRSLQIKLAEMESVPRHFLSQRDRERLARLDYYPPELTEAQKILEAEIYQIRRRIFDLLKKNGARWIGRSVARPGLTVVFYRGDPYEVVITDVSLNNKEYIQSLFRELPSLEWAHIRATHLTKTWNRERTFDDRWWR